MGIWTVLEGRMKCPRCEKEVESMSMLSGICSGCETPKDIKKKQKQMREFNKLIFGG